METQKVKKHQKRRRPKSKITLVLFTLMIVFFASMSILVTKGIMNRFNALEDEDGEPTKLKLVFADGKGHGKITYKEYLVDDSGNVTETEKEANADTTISFESEDTFSFTAVPDANYNVKVFLGKDATQEISGINNKYDIDLTADEIFVTIKFVEKPKYNVTIKYDNTLGEVKCDGVVVTPNVALSLMEGKHTITTHTDQAATVFAYEKGGKAIKAVDSNTDTTYESDNTYIIDITKEEAFRADFFEDHNIDSVIVRVTEGDTATITGEYTPDGTVSTKVRWLYNATAYGSWYNPNYYELDRSYDFSDSHHDPITGYTQNVQTVGQTSTGTIVIPDVKLEWHDYAFILGQDNEHFGTRIVLKVDPKPEHDFTIIENPVDAIVYARDKVTFTAKFANTADPQIVGWEYSRNGGTVWYDCEFTNFGTVTNTLCPTYNGGDDKCGFITTLTIDEALIEYDDYMFRAYIGEKSTDIGDIREKPGNTILNDDEDRLYNKSDIAKIIINSPYDLELGEHTFSNDTLYFADAKINTRTEEEQNSATVKEMLIEIKSGTTTINHIGAEKFGLTVEGDNASSYLKFKTGDTGIPINELESFIANNVNFTATTDDPITVRFVLSTEEITAEMIGVESLTSTEKYCVADKTISKSNALKAIVIKCNDYTIEGNNITYPNLALEVPENVELKSVQVQLTSPITKEKIIVTKKDGFKIEKVTDANYVIIKEDDGITVADFETFLRENVVFEFVEEKEMTIRWMASNTILQGDIFYNAINGHYYQAVRIGNISWAKARDKASKMHYSGLQGYLVTVRDENEDRYISSLLPSSTSPGYWAGGGSAGGVALYDVNAVLPNGYYFENPSKIGDFVPRTQDEIDNLIANVNRFSKDPITAKYYENLFSEEGTKLTEIPAGSSLGNGTGIWVWLEGPEAGEIFAYSPELKKYKNTYDDGTHWGVKSVVTVGGSRPYIQRFGTDNYKRKPWIHTYIHYRPIIDKENYVNDIKTEGRWQMCYTGHDQVKYMIVEFGGNDDEKLRDKSGFGFADDIVKWYGYLEINKKDADTGNVLGGVTFDIYSDEACTNKVDTITTDENGYAKSKGLIKGTYYLKESATKDGYALLDEVKTADVVPAETVTVEIGNKIAKGKIQINKVDKDTRRGLQGVKYEIYAKEDIVHPDGVTGVLHARDSLIATTTTDENGVAVVEDLYLGKYYAKEIETRTGYLLNSDLQDIDVLYQDANTPIVTVTKEIENKIVKGTIEINKTCNETHNGLEGVTYEIYAGEEISHPDGVSGVMHQKDELVRTVTTNYDGLAKAEELYLGKYYIKEKTTRWGYLLGTDVYNVTLEYQGNAVAEIKSITNIEDQRTLGKITVNKIDKEANTAIAQGDATLAGAIYELYAKENISHPDGKKGLLYAKDSIVATGITNEQGIVVFENLYLGEYYVREKTASNGYLLDPNTYDVSVPYEGDKVAVVERQTTSSEQVKKGPFTFNKGSVKSNTLLPGNSSSLETLENAGFTAYLISSLSKVMDGTIKSDVDGNYNVNDIIKAYFNDQTLTYDFSQEQAAIVYNEDDEGGKLTKVDGENKYVAKEMFSDKSGKVSSAELPYGKYVVVETNIPDDYPDEYFAAEPIIVTISDDSRDEKLPDDNIFAVINYPFNAKLKITKVDSKTTKPILKIGARYRIYNLDTNEYIVQTISYPDHIKIGTEENPFAVNDKGELLTVDTLEVGHYRLEEVNAPYGYVLQGYEVQKREPVEFYISKKSDYIVDRDDDKLYVVVKVKQENDPQVGKLTIIKEGEKVVETRDNGLLSKMLRFLTGEEEKISYSYEKGRIEGAEFEVYVKETIYTPDNQRDENGERIVNTYNGVSLVQDALVTRATTNANGEAIVEDLPLGIYYVKESVAGVGYVLNNEIKEVEFTYQGQEIAVVDKDIGYYNERQKADITVIKTDEKTGAPLENAEFGLYAREGEEDNYNYLLIEKAKTNKEGTIKFEADLPLGTYYIKELKAPIGYVASDAIQKVNFAYQGQDIAVVPFLREFENEVSTLPTKTVDIGDGVDTVPGEILTYTINYKNKSTRDEKIRVEDPIPEGTKYVAGHATATVNKKEVVGLKLIEPKDNAEKTSIIWESEDFVLKPNETIILTFKVKVKTEEEGLVVDKVTNKANIRHGAEIKVREVKDSYRIRYYKDNIVTGELLKEIIVDANVGDQIPWDEIDKNLIKPEGYKDGEIQEGDSARVVIKGDDDIVYVLYKPEDPVIPDDTKDSYLVRYYVDSISDENIISEIRVDAKLDSEIPWNKIDVNLKKPEGYKDGKIQEDISANIVVKGDDDIVYILYTTDRTEAKGYYTVKYYKDDVETGEYLGSEKFAGFVGDEIDYDRVNTGLKRPEGYSNGIILEDMSAKVIIEGEDNTIYVIYVKEDETNEVENPIPNPTKTVDVGNGTGIMEGQKLTYTVTYKNKSAVQEKFVIRDPIPEGTKYVAGSMTTKINKKDATDKVEITELSDMADSGELLWASKEGVFLNPNDTIVVTFSVITKTREEGLKVDDITNKATVAHGADVLTEDVTNEVENKIKNPVKNVDIGNGTVVVPGETLTYKVRYKNRTNEAETVIITDSIPKGTKYVAGSMTATIAGENVLTPDNENVKITELEDEAKKGELLWNIDKLGMNQEVEVTFKVVVLSKAEGLKVDEVTNKAVVEHIGKASGTRIKDETNEIENPVKVPEPITPPSNIDTSDINIWTYVVLVFVAVIGIFVGIRIVNTNKNKTKTKTNTKSKTGNAKK